jgi:hypothetical protein
MIVPTAASLGSTLSHVQRVLFSAVVPGANLAAEPHWRDAHDSTEDFREMTLIGEAGRRYCAGQGDFRIAQVLLRAFNSAPQDVLVWGQAGAYLE